MADDDDAGLASGAESEDQGPILSLQSLKNQQNVRGKRRRRRVPLPSSRRTAMAEQEQEQEEQEQEQEEEEDDQTFLPKKKLVVSSGILHTPLQK